MVMEEDLARQAAAAESGAQLVADQHRFNEEKNKVSRALMLGSGLHLWRFVECLGEPPHFMAEKLQGGRWDFGYSSGQGLDQGFLCYRCDDAAWSQHAVGMTRHATWPCCWLLHGDWCLSCDLSTHT